MHITYLIKKYLETYYHEYKVLNSGSKQIPSYGSEHRLLYFTDIKDFARYYNLQDRLAFPLNRTTEECMENHLIHLHSGRTIEAVGMSDI